MAKNLFAKAVEDATLAVSSSQDGSRNFRGTLLSFVLFCLHFEEMPNHF